MPTDNIVNNRLKQIQLTQNQLNVFEKFKNFLKNTEQRIFILRGYAGTGKTTLVRFFIDEMRK